MNVEEFFVNESYSGVLHSTVHKKLKKKKKNPNLNDIVLLPLYFSEASISGA